MSKDLIERSLKKLLGKEIEEDFESKDAYDESKPEDVAKI